jgi:hypothetical protein
MSPLFDSEVAEKRALVTDRIKKPIAGESTDWVLPKA